MNQKLWLLTAIKNAKTKYVVIAAEALRAGLVLVSASLAARFTQATFLDGKSLSETAPVLLVLFLVMAIIPLVGVFKTRALAGISEVLREKVRRALHAHLLSPGAKRTDSLLPLALESVDSLDLWFTRVFPVFLSMAVTMPIIIVVAAIFDPLTGLLMLVTLPIAPFLLMLIGKVTKAASVKEWHRMQELSTDFSEMLATLPTIKIFNRSDSSRGRIAVLSDSFSTAALRVLQLSFVSAFALELITTLSIALIAVSIGFRLLYAQMTFETAFFVLLITPEFFQPLRQAGAAFHSGMTAWTAEDELKRVLAESPEPAKDKAIAGKEATLAIDAAHSDGAEAKSSANTLAASDRAPGASRAPISSEAPTPAAAAPDVAFSDVSFTYPMSPLPVIRHASLAIEAGRITAVSGISGAGKSTLLRLVAGLLTPYEGSLCVAGREVREMTADARTALLSYVPQEPHLFSGTLGENVTLFHAVDEARALAALEKAHLDAAHGFTAALDAPLGEGGANLSQGQKKRLGLARAIYQARPLVLLDEPTAALDEETAALIRSAIADCFTGRTVLIATHDEALLAVADRVIDWEVTV